MGATQQIIPMREYANAAFAEDPEFAQSIDDLDLRLSQRTQEEVSKGTRVMD